MAIRDLCSRQVLVSVAFLTGPVDGSFIIRSVWLGKLVVFVFEVPTTMAQCVIPGLDVGASLFMLPGMVSLLSIWCCIN